jgi:hypothetical protein
VFINPELEVLETDKDVKLYITLNFLFMMKMLYKLQRLSICHIRSFKLKRSKRMLSQILMKVETHNVIDVF